MAIQWPPSTWINWLIQCWFLFKFGFLFQNNLNFRTFLILHCDYWHCGACESNYMLTPSMQLVRCFNHEHLNSWDYIVESRHGNIDNLRFPSRVPISFSPALYCTLLEVINWYVGKSSQPCEWSILIGTYYRCKMGCLIPGCLCSASKRAQAENSTL